MDWLRSVLGPKALSFMANSKGEGLSLHGMGVVPGWLTCSHGLQGTLAKPPSLGCCHWERRGGDAMVPQGPCAAFREGMSHATPGDGEGHPQQHP